MSQVAPAHLSWASRWSLISLTFLKHLPPPRTWTHPSVSRMQGLSRRGSPPPPHAWTCWSCLTTRFDDGDDNHSFGLISWLLSALGFLLIVPCLLPGQSGSEEETDSGNWVRSWVWTQLKVRGRNYFLKAGYNCDEHWDWIDLSKADIKPKILSLYCEALAIFELFLLPRFGFTFLQGIFPFL